MIKKKSFTSLLHYLGAGLGIFGLLFVGVRFKTHIDSIDFPAIMGEGWPLSLFLVAVYTFSSFLLVRAWWKILSFLSEYPAYRSAVALYAGSLLAKYIPGNIFQFASRQALGMAKGMAAGALLKSTVWELGLVAAAGSLYGIPALLLFTGKISGALYGWVPLSIAFVTLAFLSRKVLSPLITQALSLHFFFLMICGILFSAQLAHLSAAPLSLALLASYGAAYIFAQIVGMITPGAPAGLGVREGVMLWLAGGMLPEETLLVAIVLARLVSVAGDVCFFLLGSFFFRSPSEESIPSKSDGVL